MSISFLLLQYLISVERTHYHFSLQLLKKVLDKPLLEMDYVPVCITKYQKVYEEEMGTLSKAQTSISDIKVLDFERPFGIVAWKPLTAGY